jgi:hypothetical protein
MDNISKNSFNNRFIPTLLFCGVIWLSTGLLQAYTDDDVKKDILQKARSNNTSLGLTTLLELIADISEGINISQLGSTDSEVIQKTAALSGIVNTLKIVDGIHTTLQPLNPVPRPLKKPILSPIIDFYFASQDLKKLQDCSELAQYNKKRDLSKIKKEQFIHLLINSILKLYVHFSIWNETRNLEEDDLFEGREIKRVVKDNIVLKLVLILAIPISEFFRKRARYRAEFGDYENWINENDLIEEQPAETTEQDPE